MNKQAMTDLVRTIAARVYGEYDEDNGRTGCSTVTLQIGFVNEIVMHDGIVITDAPPAINSLVNDWVSKYNANRPGGMLPIQISPGYGGLLIR